MRQSGEPDFAAIYGVLYCYGIGMEPPGNLWSDMSVVHDTFPFTASLSAANLM